MFTLTNDSIKQGWAGIPVPGHSREYRPPIPVPENWEWFFHSRSRSQKLGMLFFIPVPKIWEWVEQFRFLFLKSKSHSRSPLVPAQLNSAGPSLNNMGNTFNIYLLCFVLSNWMTHVWFVTMVCKRMVVEQHFEFQIVKELDDVQLCETQV